MDTGIIEDLAESLYLRSDVLDDLWQLLHEHNANLRSTNFPHDSNDYKLCAFFIASPLALMDCSAESSRRSLTAITKASMSRTALQHRYRNANRAQRHTRNHGQDIQIYVRTRRALPAAVRILHCADADHIRCCNGDGAWEFTAFSTRFEMLCTLRCLESDALCECSFSALLMSFLALCAVLLMTLHSRASCFWTTNTAPQRFRSARREIGCIVQTLSQSGR